MVTALQYLHALPAGGSAGLPVTKLFCLRGRGPQRASQDRPWSSHTRCAACHTILLCTDLEGKPPLIPITTVM